MCSEPPCRVCSEKGFLLSRRMRGGCRQELWVCPLKSRTLPFLRCTKECVAGRCSEEAALSSLAGGPLFCAAGPCHSSALSADSGFVSAVPGSRRAAPILPRPWARFARRVRPCIAAEPRSRCEAGWIGFDTVHQPPSI